MKSKIAFGLVCTLLIIMNSTSVLSLEINTNTTQYLKSNSLNSNIVIDSICFNYDAQSDAITLYDCETEQPIKTPEFSTNEGTNNPAAYVKGDNIEVKVRFYSQKFYDETVKISATGTFSGLSEKEVEFKNGESGLITFYTNENIPNHIETYNVVWSWAYEDPDSGQMNEISTTTHTIYALNKEPTVDKVWKKLAEWTTKWCKDLVDDAKLIADSILNGFIHDKVIKYGEPGWETLDMLRTGGGMCGGMKELFYDACGTQGIKTVRWYFILYDTSPLDSETLWDGIVCLSPGLGRNQPGYESLDMKWRFVENSYPHPRYYGPGNENDNVDERSLRAYLFFQGDGHALNLLEYNGKVYLYDLSFGAGPYENVFNSIPSTGFRTSSQMRQFRDNYHDLAVDYLHGKIIYEDQNKREIVDNTNFSVKTSIVPDEIDGKNQLSYYFKIIDTEGKERASMSRNKKVDDIYYGGCLKQIMTGLGYSLTNKEITKLKKWVDDPTIKTNWLELRDIILKIGNSKETKYQYLLGEILEIDEEINLVKECPLSSLKSPLQMIKDAAATSLDKLNEEDSNRSVDGKAGYISLAIYKLLEVLNLKRFIDIKSLFLSFQ